MPSILGIGTDTEDINRFDKHISEDRSVSPLIPELFTPEEIRRNLSFKNPYLCFAVGFSCKESVFKALGRSWMNAPIAWNEIECLLDEEPVTQSFSIHMKGEVLEMFRGAGGTEIAGEMETENGHVVFRVILWK